MAYERTVWENGITPINAANLNNMEEGIVKAQNFIGLNPITSIDDDTTVNWATLGIGFAAYNTAGLITDQPNSFGSIQNVVADGVVYQIWQDLRSDGHNYVRTGDITNGWYGSWKRILDETDEKSALCVIKSAAQALTTSAAKVTMGTEFGKKGDAFSVGNGGILCNKDCAVEVSANIFVGSHLTANDYVYVQIYKNGTNMGIVAMARTTTTTLDIAIPPVIINVAKGDYIYLYAYNTVGARGQMGAFWGNRLTVREI